ncbi:autotransporter-associated beta strand repeat-containing protein [Zopfochytrium polystomum]|nr:autotransporter-associated beta strand repeat-containing protein [Zopfochytrium polystomum]
MLGPKTLSFYLAVACALASTPSFSEAVYCPQPPSYGGSSSGSNNNGGGYGGGDSTATATPTSGGGGGGYYGGGEPPVITLPPVPAGVGSEGSAPVNTSIKAFVDYAYTNVRNDSCYTTLETNAGVRVLRRFLDIWKPVSPFVDAGINITASSNASCAPVYQSVWTGIPGDKTDGTVLNKQIHDLNIQFSIDHTVSRTPAQALQAYLDDRRQKGYSVSDAFGPLTAVWRTLAGATTTITSMPDSVPTAINDGGNDVGLGTSDGNTVFGLAVDFLKVSGGSYASTEPTKRYFKYARPFRWSTSVIRVPQLVSAASTTPATDGGQPSGHTSEAIRDSLAMAYLFPERFQQLAARGLELGEMRIFSGYHSPLDAMGGRILGTALCAYSIFSGSNAGKGPGAVAQVRTALKAALNVTTWDDLYYAANSANLTTDRFADWATNKAEYLRRMTYGFPATGPTNVPATVPKGAEVLLETRLPYLTAAQRRLVLQSTAIPSGYPLLDDDEGWGRLNLFAAADGFAAFESDVAVTLDAAASDFARADTWKNDISGPGKLTKLGSGALTLAGSNSFTGGVVVAAGSLTLAAAKAAGAGEVYVQKATLRLAAGVTAQLAAPLVLTADATLVVAIDQEVGATTTGIVVAGDAFVDNAVLNVQLLGAASVKKGTVVTVLKTTGGGAIKGAFKTVGVASVADNVGPKIQVSDTEYQLVF